MPKLRSSRPVYVPAAVTSFFEICDRNLDGTRISDPLRVGARGGGFVIREGSTTTASAGQSIAYDEVVINGRPSSDARTSLRVVQLMREMFSVPPVRLEHKISPPIGSGFGTSGSGALGAAISISDLLELHLSLSRASEFAHIAEIDSVTGLGTVISLASGSGAIGLVTEPGAFSIGRVDAILIDYTKYSLVCVCFGPTENSSIMSSEEKRKKVNEFGRRTLDLVRDEGTPEGLLRHSRRFAQQTGIASPELLKLADKAVEMGAVGATQNMLGKAIHCLVPKERRETFLKRFGRLVPRESLFETKLCQSAPVIA
ncbi:MAG TPA: hypothetical protein VFF30_12950 [Nitrososphaerales archaeon]|nr:hypothetical protein [Nitrososphaerales archaeon]